MDAEIYIKKEGTRCYLFAMFGSDVIALSEEFEYSWTKLRQEVSKMIIYVKGLGFNVSTTLP